MKIRGILGSLALLPLAGCAPPWWQQYHPAILLDTPGATIVSVPPKEFRPAQGMRPHETAPGKMPVRVYERLAALAEELLSLKWDLSFVKDFKPAWKAEIEKGVAEKGNAIILFNKSEDNYLAFDISSPKSRLEQLDSLRTIAFNELPRQLAHDIETLDPKVKKRLMSVFDRKRGRGIIIIYDEKQSDYFWLDAVAVHRKTFTP